MSENMIEVNNSEESSCELAQLDPPFFTHMLAQSTKNTQVFLVGDPSLQEPPEEIAVFKELLIAHSEVFRLMLKDSPLAEKETVKVCDIQPATFKNLLRFVYGCNTISSLTIEAAVDLLYVAEKYLVEELKPKLVTHILSILSVDNVCAVLPRPECFQQKALNDAVVQIIQEETDVLLHQEQFLSLNSYGIVKILEQDVLAVPEIELWREVLRWANHNGPKNDATVRQMMKQPLKFIRFGTLTFEEFCKEVYPTKLLTEQEFISIIELITNQKGETNLTTVCKTLKKRDILSKKLNVIAPYVSSQSSLEVNETYIFVATHSHPIVLMNATFHSKPHSTFEATTEGLRFKCECKISVQRIKDFTDSNINLSTEPPVEFIFERDLEYGTEFQIPFIINDNYLKLLNYNQYKLTFTFQRYEFTSIKYYCFRQSKLTSDGSVFMFNKFNCGGDYYLCPFYKLTYKSL